VGARHSRTADRRRRGVQPDPLPVLRWQPAPWSVWSCQGPMVRRPFFEGCGTVWKLFNAGLCPGCNHQWRWTVCLRCAAGRCTKTGTEAEAEGSSSAESTNGHNGAPRKSRAEPISLVSFVSFVLIRRWKEISSTNLLLRVRQFGTRAARRYTPRADREHDILLAVVQMVIGDPVCGAGMYTAPSSLPVALS